MATKNQKYQNLINILSEIVEIINEHYLNGREFSEKKLLKEKKYKEIFEYYFISKIKSILEGVMKLSESPQKKFSNEMIILMRAVFEYAISFSFYSKNKDKRLDIAKDWITFSLLEENKNIKRVGPFTNIDVEKHINEGESLFRKMNMGNIDGGRVWYGNYASNFEGLIKEVFPEERDANRVYLSFSLASKKSHGTSFGFMAPSKDIFNEIASTFFFANNSMFDFLDEKNKSTKKVSDTEGAKRILSFLKKIY